MIVVRMVRPRSAFVSKFRSSARWPARVSNVEGKTCCAGFPPRDGFLPYFPSCERCSLDSYAGFEVFVPERERMAFAMNLFSAAPTARDAVHVEAGAVFPGVGLAATGNPI